MKRTLAAAISCCSLLLAGLASAQTRNPWSSSGDPNSDMRGASIDSIADGSFEEGTPNSAWLESSTNFGTPVCDIGTCGTGGGTAGPRSGDWWAWFGGIAAPETASVTQSVEISSGASARLDFYFWVGICGDPSDFLAVVVDDATLWSTTCDAVVNRGDGGGYEMASVDLDAYTDGGIHDITFTSTISGVGATNISLDDVSLTVTPSVAITEVPTLGRWGVAILALLLAGVAANRLGA